jgi:uncharacterized protein (DUF488 family)
MDGAPFGAGLDELLAQAARSRTVAMCAESVWWRCHRRLLADAAVLTRQAEVVHLMHDGRLLPHRITEGARRTRDGRLVYDLGGDQPLPFA